MHPVSQLLSWPWQVLPLNRIKRLMKEEADVKAVSAEASYAAARATVSTLQLLEMSHSMLACMQQCQAMMVHAW